MRKILIFAAIYGWSFGMSADTYGLTDSKGAYNRICSGYCDADYYPNSSDTCVKCPAGQYSGANSNTCTACTNKPANATSCTYNSTGGGSNNCGYAGCGCEKYYNWGNDSKTCVEFNYYCSSSNTARISGGFQTHCWCLIGDTWIYQGFYSTEANHHCSDKCRLACLNM